MTDTANNSMNVPSAGIKKGVSTYTEFICCLGLTEKNESSPWQVTDDAQLERCVLEGGIQQSGYMN